MKFAMVAYLLHKHTTECNDNIKPNSLQSQPLTVWLIQSQTVLTQIWKTEENSFHDQIGS